MTTLHVKSIDAETSTITSYMSEKYNIILIIKSLLGKVMMGHQLSQGAGLECKKGFVCMQHMLFTSIQLCQCFKSTKNENRKSNE